jgi:hypothetical protein
MAKSKYSMKMGGNEVGHAAVYAKPREGYGNNGYPNNIPNTQTQRTRGTKNTTRGNSHSTKMG